jgi:hypothetical protein
MSDDDPAAFGSARLDEDEAAAKGPPGWKLEHWSAVRYKTSDSGRNWRVDAESRCIVDAVAAEDAAHIARYDPSRALREVKARRAILAMHRPTQPHPEFGFTYPAAARFCGYCGPGDNWQAEQEPDHYPDALWPCGHVRILVAIWNDHPDYRQDWKP